MSSHITIFVKIHFHGVIAKIFYNYVDLNAINQWLICNEITYYPFLRPSGSHKYKIVEFKYKILKDISPKVSLFFNSFFYTNGREFAKITV